MSSLHLDIFASMPLLIVVGGFLFILLADGFLEKHWPKAFFSSLILLCAGLSSHQVVLSLPVGTQTIFGGFLYADDFTYFMYVLILAGAFLSLLLGVGKLTYQGIEYGNEYYSLLLASTAGAMIFISAAEFITLFVGLEIMSMALYSLCGAALSQRRSAESALKYFLLGSFSSAFLLYGIALLYGLTGSTFIQVVSERLSEINSPLLFFSMGLVLVGLVFKIGAVPFHFWAPDVYEGAPTSVTAYMACVIKAAAFAAAIRVLWVAFEEVVVFWSGAIWVIAALTMTLGNLVALRQTSVKRMLAYSSIAHAGYMMVALLAPGGELGGGAAILFYLVAYSLMTMGAFGVLLALSARHSLEKNCYDLSRFKGLGFSKPVLGALMALFMLSMAGIPPGLAGLLGKFYVFGAAVRADYVGLVIIGVVNSAISCFYYLRVIVMMYFSEKDDHSYAAEEPLGFAMAGALATCGLGVILFGVFPSLLYESASGVMGKLLN